MKLSYYLLSNKYIIAEKEFYIILEISYLRRDILVDIKKIKSGEERESITEEHIKERDPDWQNTCFQLFGYSA